MLVGSTGTVTNLPPCLVLNRGPLHLAQRVFAGRGSGIEMPPIDRLDFEVGVISEVLVRLLRDFFEGGLTEGGVEGPLDWIDIVSEKSERSGVTGS